MKLKSSRKFSGRDMDEKLTKHGNRVTQATKHDQQGGYKMRKASPGDQISKMLPSKSLAER